MIDGAHLARDTWPVVLLAGLGIGMLVGRTVRRKLAAAEATLDLFQQLARQRRRSSVKWILLLLGAVLCYAATYSSLGAMGLLTLAFLFLIALGFTISSAAAQGGSEARSEMVREFHEFTEHYSRAPAPSKAPRMLEFYVAFGLKSLDYGSSYKSRVAFFARVAKGNPEVVRGYEALLLRTPHLVWSAGNPRIAILQVLSIAGDQETLRFLEARLKDRRFKREREKIGELLREGTPAVGFVSEENLE